LILALEIQIQNDSQCEKQHSQKNCELIACTFGRAAADFAPVGFTDASDGAKAGILSFLGKDEDNKKDTDYQKDDRQDNSERCHEIHLPAYLPAILQTLVIITQMPAVRNAFLRRKIPGSALTLSA
jgi:hypothetical protein